MKKLLFITSAILILAASCSKDDSHDMEGSGILTIKASVDSKANEGSTRATSKDPGDYTLILDGPGGRREMTFPADGIIEDVAAGDYTITVTSHVNMPIPAFDTQVYTGTANASVQPDGNTPVEIKCTQANAGIFFEYDPSLAEAGYTDVVPTITQSSDQLVYEGENRDSKGYFSPGDVTLSLMDGAREMLMGGQKSQTFSVAEKDLLKVRLFIEPTTSRPGSVGMSVSVEIVSVVSDEEVTVDPAHEVELTIAGDAVAGITQEQYDTVTKLTLTGDMPDQAWAAITNFKVLRRVIIPDFAGMIPSLAFYGAEWDSNLPETVVSFTADKVTEVGNKAFSYTKLQVVNLPEVLTIGEEAFSYCDQLKSVHMPKLETAKKAAFARITVHSLELPALKTAGEQLFGNSYMEHFSAISLETVANSMFSFCTKLLSVELPKVKTVSASAFSHCRLLEKVSLPLLEAITGTYAFSYCYVLEGVDFPNLKGEIPAQTFINCRLLSKANIPLVKTLGNACFSGCTILETLTAGAVETIDQNAFHQAIGFKNADFPSVVTLRDYAFRDCSALTTIDMPKLKTMETGREFYNCFAVKTIKMDALTEIKGFSFSNFTNLESVSFNSVETVGMRAFVSCVKLTEVRLPNAKKFVSTVFGGCSNLRTVYLPELTETGGATFLQCSSLKEISLPKLHTFEALEFSACPALEKLYLGHAGSIFTIAETFQELTTSGVELHLNSAGAEIGNVTDGKTWKDTTWKSVTGYTP